ncbi:DUF3800 domain-containing protein [Paenibacillus pasadenensis]|uniref:DUF3800 domain-containing protein n=1 Tax=Paenibacillus pasadenensis TaxID=217090 RepID=UPI00203BDA11|nr:DUF3800 domain-containing protein [Paenibacillus pasadenensis]MCM3746899.1 DUF3800 domain-containing protein [Paenibacillus pasadenensis]
MEYTIYMDESNDEGAYFGNFYGGALIRSTDIDKVTESIKALKSELNCLGEVKWGKVTLNYLEKYIALMDYFFTLIEQDIVKIRIMFTQNYRQPTNLSLDQRAKEYELLYYQFFKHAFGLKYCNPNSFLPVKLRIYFDELPVSKQKASDFKDFITNIPNTRDFSMANIKINKEDVTEVRSHNHEIMQLMDIVLGSMYFKLNNLHLVKPEGQRLRGKKTIAKEKLYKYINSRIRGIYPGFNVGVSTGITDLADRWNHPYRHWLFIPSEFRIMPEYSKKQKNSGPISPTSMA